MIIQIREKVQNYRPISMNISSISSRDKKSIKYSQGNTSVFVTSVENTDKIGSYHIKSYLPLLYKVSNNSDIIKNEEYRKNRRHYEILEFIEAVLKSVGLISNGENGGYRERIDKKIAICVTSTDGSSRTTAINGVGMYALRQAKIYKIPVAISFGMYENQIVYDLNYKQDSEGNGDCAIGAYCDCEYACNKIYVVSLLYEGAIPLNKFMQGLEKSEVSMIQLVEVFKKHGYRG